MPALREALAGLEKLPEIMVGDEGIVEVSLCLAAFILHPRRNFFSSRCLDIVSDLCVRALTIIIMNCLNLICLVCKI